MKKLTFSQLNPYKCYTAHLVHNRCGTENLIHRYGKDISALTYTEYYCKKCKMRTKIYHSIMPEPDYVQPYVDIYYTED